MFSKWKDYLNRLFLRNKTTEGRIELKVEVPAGKPLSFRIDAVSMQVNWGDGKQSNPCTGTEQFTHMYPAGGCFVIVVSGKNITDIDLPGCCITALDVSGCSTLEFINCSNNLLEQLDVRNCKCLYELHCADNRLRELRLEKYKKLFYLSCESNRLEELKVEGCKNLVNLYCRNNRLRALDVSHCRKLVSVNVEGNAFDQDSLQQFISTLASRPKYNVGFLEVQHVEGERPEEQYLRDFIFKKGWLEI